MTILWLYQSFSVLSIILQNGYTVPLLKTISSIITTVIRGLVQKLKEEAGKYGLTINQNKTKYMRLSRTQTHRKDIETEMKFEEVSRVKYLGTTVTKDNLIEEEIKERIATRNRAFFVNQKIFQSKLIAKKTRIKLYKALIRPVVVYGSESWVLTENIEQKLLVFERKI